MQQSAINAYTTVQTENLSGRDLEAHVLTKAGTKLKQAVENWNAPDREEKLTEAIRYNQKVWSFFQAELSDPENPLPKNIREDILNLSLFIDKRLFEVLAYPSPEKLQIVIDINFNLAAGLRARPQANE